ncbi:uncharacterized protein KZ484_012521 isoform 2-T5 [Pholidichthys leucotaenia]
MMAEFRWSHITLCLILISQYKGATSVMIKVGGDVTLPCAKMIDGQNNCNATTWLFRKCKTKTLADELIKLGKLYNTKSKSDRLTVTENCSLAIKEVKFEDAGRYFCQQYRPVGPIAHQSNIDLSLVLMSEHRDGDKVKLTCSVSSYEACHYTVKWLYDGKPVDTYTQQSLCSASVSFPEYHCIHPHLHLLKCELTDENIRKVQQFAFISQPSGGRTGDNDASGDTKKENSPWFPLDYIMFVMHLIEVLLITVITVLLIKAQGNRRQLDERTVFSVRSLAVKRPHAAGPVISDENDPLNYENLQWGRGVSSHQSLQNCPSFCIFVLSLEEMKLW